jgi:hypothetical protein
MRILSRGAEKDSGGMKRILSVIAYMVVLLGALPAYAAPVPTGDLLQLYGAPEMLEFLYNPGNTVSLGSGGSAEATGSNSDAMAFLEISNSSNPFALNSQIYFESAVQTGQMLFADATINPFTLAPVAPPDNQFSTASGAEVYAYIFTSEAAFDGFQAPIQTMSYSTHDPMHIDDTIGSLELEGYVGVSGGYTVSETTPLPASLLLFVTGLGMLGMLGWPRKKAAAIVIG